MDVVKHFTATGIVRNHHGGVLLIRHKKLGVWLPPGGHVEENETPDDAVLREILEETGVRARIVSPKRLSLRPVGCTELYPPFLSLLEDIAGDGSHLHIDLIYLCEAESEALRAQETETTGIGWFDPESVPDLDTYENVRQSIRLAVQKDFFLLNDRQ